MSDSMALGLGEDGQRDYWGPYGDGDLLRRTWQLAFTNGFRRDADIEGCLDIASRGGAQVMAGVRPDGSALIEDGRFGLGLGAPADFVLVEADTVTSAIMDCPTDRDVFKAGRLIASGGAAARRDPAELSTAGLATASISRARARLRRCLEHAPDRGSMTTSVSPGRDSRPRPAAADERAEFGDPLRAEVLRGNPE
jgi:hypothetical protein